MTEPQSLSVSFDITPDEIRRHLVEGAERALTAKHGERGLQKPRFLTLSISVILTAAAVCLLGMDWPFTNFPWSGILFSAMAIVGWTTVFLIDPTALDKERLKLIEKRVAKLAEIGNLSYSIVINAAHIHCSTRYEESRTRWEAIMEVVDRGWAIEIASTNGGCFLVPKRSFSDPTAVERFLQYAGRKLADAGYDAASRIRAYLTSHDLNCPRCRYNLRGVATCACPECGLELTLENVPAATTDPRLPASESVFEDSIDPGPRSSAAS